MSENTVLRAYRFPLDPTPRQREELLRYAGASRWAYNWALAQKMQAHEAYRQRIAELTATGLTAEGAKARFRQEAADARAKLDTAEAERQTLFNAVKRRKADDVGVVGERLETLRLEQAEAQRAIDAATTPQDTDKARKAWAKVTAELNTLLSLTEPDEHGRVPQVPELRRMLETRRVRRDRLKEERFRLGYEVPSGMSLSALWRSVRDLPREEGGSPWHAEVNSYCFSDGFSRADAAWKNWLESFSGKRAGRRIGYPRFKKKGRASDTFSLYHDAKAPGIRPENDATNRYHTGKAKSATPNRHRGITLPKLGRVRVKGSTRRLVRAIRRGGVVKSVTISRAADQWYASVLCEVPQEMPSKPTRRQAEKGTVAVKWGVREITLLDKEGVSAVPQPRYLEKALRKLRRAQRRASKATLGSNKRAKHNKATARIHHSVALKREGFLNQLSARLAKEAAVVAVEHLNVADMVRSDTPRAKSKRRNRAVLDTAPGEFQRQLGYKTLWNGSRLALTEPGMPTTRTCANCGAQNPSTPPRGQVFHCGTCNASAPRNENAVRVVARYATVPAPRQDAASDRGEAQNARGVPVRPSPSGGGHGAVNREDPQGGSP